MSNIAVIMQAHNEEKLLLDTLDAVRTYATDKIMVVIDGAAWSWGRKLKLPAYKIQGLRHAYQGMLHRNTALGMLNAVKQWPDVDWYCIAEPDTLFVSDMFKHDLLSAPPQVWCMGIDRRAYDLHLPYLDFVVGEPVSNESYRFLIGCCVFYRAAYIKKLASAGVLERMLTMTNGLHSGFFPGFGQNLWYSTEEIFFPTLAIHFGGRVHELACWNDELGHRGDFYRYSVRFRPEVELDDITWEASVIHPVKKYDSPVRERERERRERRFSLSH